MKKIFKASAIVLVILFIFLNVVVAFHAYKFTHFYDNTVAPAKKAELMSGWEETEAILFGINYSKHPPSDYPAHPFNTFYTKTTDGIVLQGWYIPKSNSKGTMVLFHGHGGSRGSIVTEANDFYNLGYNVCMVDFRAHGVSQGNICTIGYNESADVKAAYDYVAAKGEKNIVLWGISLGAATITKAMTDYKEIRPAKVILEMPFASLTDAVKGKLRIMQLPLQPLTTLLTFWGAVEQQFWTFNHNPSDYVKNIHVPVLLQWGRNDIRVTEAETEEIFQNLSTRQKRLVIYNNSGHESLARNEPGKWNATIKSFLDAK
jgi:alpha-beta hydrolase superfamily lysophospholipase